MSVGKRSGDTGYCGSFKQIGRKYGPITLSAIPIGAYEPRWVVTRATVAFYCVA